MFIREMICGEHTRPALDAVSSVDHGHQFHLKKEQAMHEFPVEYVGLEYFQLYEDSCLIKGGYSGWQPKATGAEPLRRTNGSWGGASANQDKKLPSDSCSNRTSLPVLP